MRRVAKIFLCTGLIAASAAPAAAQINASNAVFQARYAAMKTAMAARDEKAIESLLTPDLESVDASGKATSEQDMLTQLRASPKDPNRTSSTTLLFVKENGDKATIGQRYEMHTIKQETGAADKAIALTSVSTDTWVKSSGTWLLQRTETKQIDVTVDGAQVLHKTSATP